MKKKHYVIIIISIVSLFIAIGASGDHISKYFQVDNKILYRSSQPDFMGFLFVKNEGIKSVINFRDDRNDSNFLLHLMGFKHYLNLKVEDRYPPSEEQVQRFLDFVTDKENQPVLMHCRSGKGRAGTFEVLYHHFVEGKSIDESIKDTMLANKISDIQIDWLHKIPESGTSGKYTDINHPPDLDFSFATM